MADEQPPLPPAPPEGTGTNGNGEHYDPLNIADELRDSYLTYAMSVIVSRALPDVRDGLKPSQRRILVAMHDLGLGPNSATSKCAGIIGETMKRYHPHGDQSIYMTLVHMAQWWAMRHRLIHPQGNFGSIEGQPPAAHRYTEARLTQITAEMLADLEADTVDFIDNYDGKYREPLVLPCKFPNLLVNGSDGIAVGMATEIPPHNLREVCDALIMLIDNPHAALPEIMAVLPGPDFPTGGIIRGKQGLIDAYTSGRGRIAVQARAEIVLDAKPVQIVIKEVPFQVNRRSLMEEIGELIKNERIKNVRDVRDESSERQGEPVRIVVELKKDGDPDLILNQLYEFSSLQKTQSIILLALVDARPRTLGLKQMLEEFLRHRLQVIRRRTEFQLREAKKRTHLLEGLLVAISSLDEIIALIRRSPSRAEAKIALQDLEVASSVLERALGADHFTALQREIGVHASYRMTEAQVEAIVRMQLGQLAALERDEIFKEYLELREKILGCERLLSDDANVRAVIRADLLEMRTKFGDDRKTFIDPMEVGRFDMEALIEPETMAVTISHEGYIKRLPLTSFRSAHRGAKGIAGGATRENDFVEHFFTASTHDYLLCFTNRGHMYWLRVFDIPEATRIGHGRAMANVLQLKEDERITSVIAVQKFDAERDKNLFLLMATRRGIVKKTALLDYSNVRAGGIIGISLDEGDTLINVVLTRPRDEVVLCTRNGMAIRFDEAQARAMGRNTRGVRGINLQGDDEVVGLVVCNPAGFLLSVCEKGYGKRTPFGANTAADVAADGETEAAPSEEPEEVSGEEEAGERSSMYYRKQRRGGKGIRDIKTGERNGRVVGVAAVSEEDDIMLITGNGMVNRTHVREIRITGRNTMGVRVMGLNEGDKLAVLAHVAPEAEAEGEPAETPAES